MLFRSLTKYEHEAWESGDREKVVRCLEYEKLFLESHPDKWVPLFCDKVIEAGELTFYREMARLTKEYLSLEKRYVNESIDRFVNTFREYKSSGSKGR